ncbi:MAG TPA: VWA domain-containing protein [Candidatus Brocadiia bacterium]|nr:VWA domain-containing protein [Candidatus Brocadiia bacterium]
MKPYLPLGFANPEWLILLLLPLVYWQVMRRGRLWTERWRRKLALILRSLLIVLLVLVLAGVHWKKRVDRLELYYVVDVSDSIPRQLQQKALEWSLAASEQMDQDRDKAGLIVFGKDAGIEALLSAPYTYAIESKKSDKPAGAKPALGYRSIVESEESDIAGALNLAMAAFTGRAQRRIVLVSDGNSTRGNPIAATREAAASGIPIDVLPITYLHSREVWVSKVLSPPAAKADEPFQCQIVVESAQDTKINLNLNDKRYGGAIARIEDIELKQGKNVIPLELNLKDGGFHFFEAIVEAEDDTIPVNNKGLSFTHIEGKNRILYIEGDIARSNYLKDALEKEGISCEVRDAGMLPDNALELQDYDAVILSNVPAFAFSDAQMKLLEHAVRDFGIGLVMVGGEHSFGPGGYKNTPVEAVLPVEMDIRQKRVMLNGALALVLHTCEFDAGNKWALRISKAAINALSDGDIVGVVDYDWAKGCSWAVEMQPAANRAQIMDKLNNLHPGDMPTFEDSMKLACEGLTGADAFSKHMIIISDGDPAAPGTQLINQIIAAGITISTICINPHTPSDAGIMRSIANKGQGRFYNCTDPNLLPQIFIREASSLRRSLIVQKDGIQPAIASASQLILGFEKGIPSVDGYVVTSAKPNAEVPLVVMSQLQDGTVERDPFLAHWHCGLGKSVAFASDVRPVWAHRWVSWEGYPGFWAQVARWVGRAGRLSDYEVTTSHADGKGRVVLQALDNDGRPVNFLDAAGTAYSPSGAKVEVQLSQVAPGRYEGTFDATEVGVHAVRIAYRNQDGSVGTQSAGLGVGYSLEYAALRTDTAALKRIAEITGGRIYSMADNVVPNIFSHGEIRYSVTEPAWRQILAAAIVLLLLDVAARRVAVSRRQVREFAALLVSRQKRAREEPEEALQRLLKARSQVREKFAEAPRPAADARPAAPPASGITPPTEPKKPEPAKSPEQKKETPPSAGGTLHERLLDAKRKAREQMKKPEGSAEDVGDDAKSG